MKKSIFSLAFLLISVIVFAQNASISSGGDASGVGGTTSYSVGQVIYTTNSGVNGSVAQGVQQPYEISVITEINQTQKINLNCSVYPNPTTDFLILSVTTVENSTMNFQLFDVSGKLLVNKPIQNETTEVLMQNLPKSSYFLKVYENNKTIKIFKVIKQ